MIKLLKSLQQKIILMISKAIITSVKDSGKIQLVQVNLGNDEIIDSVERVQQFGFSSFPVKDSEAIVLCIAGDREHPIVIGTDSGEHRPILISGETALYNAFNAIIKLKQNLIEINTLAGTPLLAKDGVLTGNTINPVTGSPFASVPSDVSQFVRVKHL